MTKKENDKIISEKYFEIKKTILNVIGTELNGILKNKEKPFNYHSNVKSLIEMLINITESEKKEVEKREWDV